MGGDPTTELLIAAAINGTELLDRVRDLTRELGETRAALHLAERDAAQLDGALREVLAEFAQAGQAGWRTAGWVPDATMARWRAVLDADPDDPAPDRTDLLGAVGRLTEAVTALQQLAAGASGLPPWVLDLVRGLIRYEAEHPKLYAQYAGSDEYQPAECAEPLMLLVPAEVRAALADPDRP